jgi:hypothetical protein
VHTVINKACTWRKTRALNYGRRDEGLLLQAEQCSQPHVGFEGAEQIPSDASKSLSQGEAPGSAYQTAMFSSHKYLRYPKQTDSNCLHLSNCSINTHSSLCIHSLYTLSPYPSMYPRSIKLSINTSIIGNPGFRRCLKKSEVPDHKYASAIAQHRIYKPKLLRESTSTWSRLKK